MLKSVRLSSLEAFQNFPPNALTSLEALRMVEAASGHSVITSSPLWGDCICPDSWRFLLSLAAELCFSVTARYEVDA
jgi:hypothetical protein